MGIIMIDAFYQLYLMSKSKSQIRHKTEENIDAQLDKMLFMAAQQKMLPKIIFQYSSQHHNPKFLNQYRDHVKQIYTKETANPLIYNQDEAKTNRQKFREKILKLVNNQLPIDYLKPMKMNGKFVMTYKGEPLQKIQYPTQPQYKIFNDFSESKFKNGFQDVFDDKLQYKHLNVIRPVKKQVIKKAKTSQFRNLQQMNASQNIIQKQSSKKRYQTETSAIAPKLVARSLFDKHRLLSPISPKKKIKNIKPIKQGEAILNIMKRIGGYYNANRNDISITKQSILRYFRQYYPRPHRIVDFLQFLNVQNFYTFSKIPMKLKLMPNQHIYFMVFLFYDSNNDGYICNNDLIRMEQMIHKSKLILQDYEIIKKGAFKTKFQTQITYKELYRLPQVTESTFFQWLKKQKANQNPEIQNPPNAQLKDYFQHLNRRKIFIHYQAFKKLFANEKPYLWYDILWRVSGIQYEGLSYQ